MRARFSRLYVSSCWISTPTTSTLTRRLSLFESFQWWPLHEHGREDPPARRLHHRLHHRVGSGGSSDPQQPVSLPPGEPATSVKIWDTQTGERVIAHLFFFKYTMSLKSWIKCESGAFFFLTFFAVFHLADHPQLWDVWKQEQHHQFERGFSCGGGSIKVRDRSVFKDVVSVSTLFSESNPPPPHLCLPGSSLCTVSCTQSPHGVPPRLLFRATAPFSSSSPSCLGIWKARGDQCFVLDCTAAVFLLQLCAVLNSFTGLLCGPPRDYSFLSRARTSSPNARVEDSSSRQGVAFSVKALQAISWALWCIYCL